MQADQPAGRDGEAAALRAALVDRLVADGLIRSDAVEDAFRAVPRHLFVPGVSPEQAYRDQAIPTKRLGGLTVSSASQPAIMAIMLEQLALRPGHRVLEIGAGTGYNAALMARIVGATGRVVSVDIDDDIVDAARAHLAAAGYPQVRVVTGDGAFGASAAAPFDRIVLTVGAADISPAWREQLAPAGRLLLPLRLGGVLSQKSVLFEQVAEHLVSTSIHDCQFVMLRGAHAQAESGLRLGPEQDLDLWSEEPLPLDPEAADRLLAGPGRDSDAGTRLTARQAWGGLIFWLGLVEPGLCGLAASEAAAARPGLPWLVEPRAAVPLRMTVGLAGPGGLTFLTRPPATDTADSDGVEPFRLGVRAYGRAEQLVRRLLDRIAAWEAAGRPASDGLRIAAYPADAPLAAAVGAVVVDKTWSRLVLTWERPSVPDSA